MSPIRVVIADDEPYVREGLLEFLQQDPDVEIVAECPDGPATVAAIERTRPDAIFLDVRMPGLDGFEVLDRLPEGSLPLVVFVTAHDDYALKAFDVHAVDYLLKPFDHERVKRAVGRIRTRIDDGADPLIERRLRAAMEAIARRGRESEQIVVHIGVRTVVVDVEEIDWIEADGNYVRLRTGERSYLARETMRDLEERLATHGFMRIHRSTLVAWRRVREVRTSREGGTEVVLRDGTRLAASETGARRLRRRLRE